MKRAWGVVAAIWLSACGPTSSSPPCGGDCPAGEICRAVAGAAPACRPSCRSNSECGDNRICDPTAFVCVERVAAKCTKNEECKADEACDATLGQCVPILVQPCTRECGKYQKCQRDAGGTELCVVDSAKPCDEQCGDASFTCEIATSGESATCVLAAGVTASAEMVAPTEGTKFKRGAVDLECKVRVPQLRSVKFEVTHGEGATTLAAANPSGERWTATFDASEAADGAWSAKCLVEFGPVNSANGTRESQPRGFVIDSQGPTIAAQAPTGWHKHEGTLEVKATVTDRGAAGMLAGVDAATVRAKGAGFDVAGVATGSAGEYRFTVDLGSITPADVQGEVAITVTASDLLGNVGEMSSTASVLVDAVAPVVEPTTDTSWKARSGAAFEYAAKVTVAGAGLKTDGVTLTANGHTYAGMQSGDQFRFTVLPADLAAADFAGEVAFTVKAEDEAGQATSATGRFRVDGSAPVVQVQTVDQDTWFGPGATTTAIVVTVTDTGSGAALTRFKAGGAVVPTDCDGSGSTRTCVVPLQAIASGTENAAYPVEITLVDNVGNLATPAQTHVKVDKKQPPTLVAADVRTNLGTWLPRSATPVNVIVTLRDGGSGLDATSGKAPKLVFGSGTTVTYVGAKTAGTTAEGDWTFAVKTEDLIAAGTTNAAVGANLTFQDVAGNQSSGSLSLKIDGEPPTLTPAALSTEPIKRNVKAIVVKATVSDTGAGVDAATVKLTYTGKDGAPRSLTPTAAGNEYTWSLDASDPELKAAEGTVTLSYAAKDAIGNGPATGQRTITITRKLWEFDTGIAVKVLGGVALAGGKAYFALDTIGSAGGNVWAVSTIDGTLLWSAELPGMPTTPLSISATRAYIASNFENGSLHAFDTSVSGVDVSPAWTCSNYGINRGALAVATVDWHNLPSETVFYGSDDPSFAAFRRNATNTDCDTRHSGMAGEDVSISSPAHAQGAVWSGSVIGSLVRAPLGATMSLFGSAVLSIPPPSGLVTYPVPGVALAGDGGAFYVVHNNLYRVSSAMTVVYQGTSVNLAARVLSQPTLLADRKAVFGSDNGYLFSFDASSPTPAPTFEFPVVAPNGALKAVRSSPTIGEDSSGLKHMYFGANDKKFHALTESGIEAWSYNVGADVESSAALDCSGVAYFGTNNGKLVALQTDSAGLAKSSWPRFQHDNRNTGSLTTPIYVNGVCQD